MSGGAADLGNLDALVVERVHEVGGELLAAAALIAFEDQNPSAAPFRESEHAS